MEDINGQSLLRDFPLLSQIGITMVVCILGCSLLGLWIDKKIGTRPIFTLIFIVIGVLSAFMNLHKTLKSYMRKESE